MVPEARIGTAEGEGPYTFAQIMDVALDGMGRVWVVDAQHRELRVFDPSGRHVRTIGRKGAGPREFNEIAGMDWAPDGSLWVLDSGNSRFAVYDTAGRLVATHPRSTNVSITPWPGGLDAEGRVYDTGSASLTDPQRTQAVIRFAAADRQHADTLVLPSTPQQVMGQLTRGDARNQRVSMIPVPFTGRAMWTLDPAGYAWIATTDRYRLERRSFDGKTERVVELRHTPMRVTEAEKDDVLKRYDWFVKQGGTLDRSKIPDTHPALLTFFVDGSSRLYVMPAIPPGENSAIDVFDPQGSYLGRVRLPVRVSSPAPPVVRNGRMAVVVRDENDVQTVVLLRIEKRAR